MKLKEFKEYLQDFILENRDRQDTLDEKYHGIRDVQVINIDNLDRLGIELEDGSKFQLVVLKSR